MLFVRRYLHCLLVFTAFASHAQDETPEAFYEDLNPYVGLSLIKVSGVQMVPGVFLGIDGSGRHLKYDLQFNASLSRGHSGTRLLSAYSHTSADSKEVAFDSKTGYLAMVFGGRYYFRNTAIAPEHNCYTGLGLATQYFSLTTSNGRYDPSEFYVRDEIYKHTEVNYGVALAIRLAGGYQYQIGSRFSLIADLAFDWKIFHSGEASGQIFPGMNVWLLNFGAKYRFVLSR